MIQNQMFLKKMNKLRKYVVRQQRVINKIRWKH